MGALWDFLNNLSWAKQAGGIGAVVAATSGDLPPGDSAPTAKTAHVTTIPEVEIIAGSPEAQAAIRSLAPSRTPADQPEIEAHLATTGHIPESDYMARQFYHESMGDKYHHITSGDGAVYAGLGSMGTGALQSQGLFKDTSENHDFEGIWTKRMNDNFGINAPTKRDEEGHFTPNDAGINLNAFKNLPYEAQAMIAFEDARSRLQEIRSDPELKNTYNREQVLTYITPDNRVENFEYKGEDELWATDATRLRIASHAGIGGLKQIMHNSENTDSMGMGMMMPSLEDKAAQSDTTRSALPFTNLDIPFDDPLRSDKSIYEMNKAELREVAKSLDIDPENLEKMGLYKNAPNAPVQEHMRYEGRSH